jgi:16S rRNA processing protein RimM
MAARIHIGTIVGAHGVRGEVKIKSFTASPADIAAYGPVSDEPGARRFKLKVLGLARDTVIARLEGVADRNAAEALKGLRLYVPRAALPDTDDGEFYRADLIGLRVERADGSPYGRIAGIEDYGAGDVVEVALSTGGTEFLPLTRRVFPLLDPKAGRAVVEPPPAVEAKPETRDSAGTAAHG